MEQEHSKIERTYRLESDGNGVSPNFLFFLRVLFPGSNEMRGSGHLGLGLQMYIVSKVYVDLNIKAYSF